MKNAYCKFVDVVNRVYITAALATLSLLVIFSVLQVASRYIAGFKVLGMEELARMMFVWTASLGASIGVSRNAHPRVDMLLNLAKGKFRAGWEVLLELIFMTFFVFLLVFSLQKIANVMATNQVTPLFKIPMQYLYSALVVSAVGALLNEIRNILNSVLPGTAPAKKEV